MNEKVSRKKKIMRVLAAAIAFCLMFTYPNIQDIMSVFAAEAPGEDGTAPVSTSAEPSEEAEEQPITVKTSEQNVPVEMEEQTTPLGTAVEHTVPVGTAAAELAPADLPQADIADPAVQALIDNVSALPDNEEYLAKEPDAEAEEAYSQWMEGLHRYAGEALDIQEAYDALTEEQMAQIPAEAQEKLAAWAQTAMLIAEGSISTMAGTYTPKHKNTAHKECINSDVGSHVCSHEVLESGRWAEWNQRSFDSDSEYKKSLYGTNYYLSENITIKKRIEFSYVQPEDSNVVICLNGYSITFDPDSTVNDYYKFVFDIPNGATVSICDCQGGGVITGATNTKTEYNGGIKTYNGALNLYSGKITGCTGDYGSVALRGQDAKFNMYGGEISGNTATSGGGVYVGAGTFNMYGGTISNNTATNGGGVYVSNNAAFAIGGNVTINSNTKSDGSANNVYLDNKTITVENGVTGFNVGVTTNTAPTCDINTTVAIANASTDVSSKFSSDNSAYKTAYKDGAVKLTAGHTEETIPGKEPTCTGTGLEAGKKCSVCGAVIAAQAVKPAKGHIYTYSANKTNDTTVTFTQTCSNGCGHSATATFSMSKTSYYYTGSAVEPVEVTYPTGTWAGTQPTESNSVVYSNNTNKGTATATITVEGKKETLNFTIDKQTPYFSVTMSQEEYSYGDFFHPSYSSNNGGEGGTVKFYYKPKDAPDSAYTSTKPTELGTYIVKGTLPESNTYNSRSETAEFTISRKDLATDNISISVEDATYTGSACKPTVSVQHKKIYDGWVKLTEGTDYTVSCTSINAGTASVKITGKGNYSGTVTKNFTINKATPTVTEPTGLTTTYGQTLANITLPSGWTWNDSSTSVGNVGNHTFSATYIPSDTNNYNTVTRQVTIKVNKANPTYTTPTNLTATYGDTLASVTLSNGWTWKNSSTSVGDVGTRTFMATYTPSDTDNYSTRDVSLSVTVNAKSISGVTISNIANQTYTGSTITPSITVKDGTKTLTSSNYTVSYSNNTNAGTATVTVTGKGNYTGTASKNFTIIKATPTYTAPTNLTATYGDTLAKVKLPTADNGTWTWNNSSAKVGKVGNDTFTATYTPKDTKNYITLNNISVTVKVGAKSISGFTINPIPSKTYTGSAIRPAVTVKDGITPLAIDTDYTVGYSNNINQGTATVTVTGKGNYKGSKTATFTITPKSLTDNMVTLSFTSKPYTGSEIKPTVTVKDGSALKSSDYTVSYSNNINKGTAKVTVVGQNNYQGTINKEFTITAADIRSAIVTLSTGTLTYNGSEQTKSVTGVTVNGRSLTVGTDYEVTTAEKGTNVGTYNITITGIGNYAGTTKTVTFKIEPKPLADSMITVASGPHYYTGKPITPVVTVKDGNTPLVENKDYTVEYSNNTETGEEAILTVKGKGNYKGTLNKKFTIKYQPLPANKSLKDYVTISPTPNEDGWYGSDIKITPKDGYDVGNTDTATGGVTITGETGTDGRIEPIYIKDGENIYQTTFSYKLDQSQPVADLEKMTVENGSKPFNNLITGKSNMIIKIPESCFTDIKSGIAEVSYAATPEGVGTAKSGTIDLNNGNYEIDLDKIDLGEEFVGKIELTVKDNVGHTTKVTLPTATGKVIVEEHKPEITFTLPDSPTPNDDDWYSSSPVTITAAVKDNQGNITSGGIAKIEWKDGESGKVQTVTGLPGTTAAYDKEFTISVDTDGTHIYYVRAIDNAGNVSTGIESAGAEGWKTITVKVDTGAPVFNGDLTAENRTEKGADITFTPSEKVKAYWIVSDAETPTDPQAVKDQFIQNGGEPKAVEKGTKGSLPVSGLTTGQKHTVYVVLEDVAGNLSAINNVSFLTQQEAPDLTLKDLNVDYTKETIKLLPDVGEVEIFTTDPSDPTSNPVTPNDDGILPVKPGTSIYIRYPEKTEGDLSTPPSDSVKIDIPHRPTVPAAKHVTVTDTTVKVTDPSSEEEYVLVPKGQTPDWSKANTTGQFSGLTPNTEYDLYARKKATENSFVSNPVKTTGIRTYVTIKDPIVEGEGAGADGNTATKPSLPNEDGSVTFTGSYGEEYTPVIKADDNEYAPEMTWDEENKKGTWEYTLTVPDGETDAEITVEFRKRKPTGIKITPDSLTIYADDPVNVSIDALKDYVKANSSVKAAYDNKTSRVAEAVYTTTGSFTKQGAAYTCIASAEAMADNITLTVKAVTATATSPDKYIQVKNAEGYTVDEVSTWLPAQVTVSYTGDGYTTRTEIRTVTWDTSSIGSDFGTVPSENTIMGAVDLPVWATGSGSVSMTIKFIDRFVLKDDQIKIDLPDFSYGEQSLPNPKGSITVTDNNPTYTYLYSTDGGSTWVTEDQLPKSDSGYIVPDEYSVKVTYIGERYMGEKTVSFTVEKHKLTILPGTLEVLNKNYDGNNIAEIKEGGQPTLSGVIEGDNVTLGGSLSAEFTDMSPNFNIPVTVTGFIPEGEDAEYYEFKKATLTLYATIKNANGTSPGGGNRVTISDNGDNTTEENNDPDTTTPAPTPELTNPTEPSQPTATQENPAENNTKPAITEISEISEISAITEITEISAITEITEISETTEISEATEQPEQGTESNDTDAPNQESTEPAQPQGETTQTVQASVEGGKLKISDETASTGNAAGTSTTTTATTATTATTTLTAGDGTVTVKVVCEEEKYTAGVKDTVAVANAVLKPEQIKLVNEGENIEIRVDVKDISEAVPEQDKEVIDSGLAECRAEMPDMTLGMYVDISMFVKVGKSDWNAVTSTAEPIDVVVGIPKELQEDGREFYIIRSHDGEHTLLTDMDDDPNTITVETSLFSAYAIAYEQIEDNTKCGLCHICPTFLGICCFIWMAIPLAMIPIIWIIIRKKRKTQNEEVK